MVVDNNNIREHIENIIKDDNEDYKSGGELDIAYWDTSRVTNMNKLFYESKFNGDISRWDVSNVTDMSYMFYASPFDQDISKWNVSNVIRMDGMFTDSQMNNIPKWYPKNIQ